MVWQQETLDRGDCLLLCQDSHCSPKPLFLQTIFPQQIQANLHRLSPNLSNPTKFVQEKTVQFLNHTCLDAEKIN